MPVPDFFTGSAFTSLSLTMGINKFPNMYGRLRELNLFPADPVATRKIAVEEYNGVLAILPTVAAGGPATQNKSGKRKVRTFEIPHIPLEDVILPEEVQGVRMFGSENMLETQERVMARKLMEMRNKHAITLEYLRMGALKGVILDADASTLYNLYTEFDITQKEVFFALGTDATDVRAKCMEVKRHIEDNLKGEVMQRIHCLCSQEFYDNLTGHPEVEKAFQNFQTNQRLSGDYRTAFEYAGIVFEEYRGVASDKDGNSRRFIADGDAHFFPVGTLSTFKTYFAPADFNETANTLGLEVYAKQEARKFGRGWDVHTQSNPLPMCHRPELLVRGDDDAS
jgi:hypothetical protein